MTMAFGVILPVLACCVLVLSSIASVQAYSPVPFQFKTNLHTIPTKRSLWNGAIGRESSPRTNSASSHWPTQRRPSFESSSDDNESSLPQKQLSTPLDEPVLAALDAVALIVFASVGKASHSADGAIDVAAVLAVAFPFLLSWFGTSPLTGVYRDDCSDIRTTIKGWAVSVPLGCAIRGVIKGYVPPVPFVVVTLIVTLVILTTTRFAYSKVVSAETS